MPRYIDADLLKTDYYALPKSLSSLTVSTQYVSLSQILNAPAADVRENVHAHWIRNKECAPDVGEYECSHCHRESFIDNDFCGNCGAQMDERSEDD